VLNFPLPDQETRKRILDKILEPINANVDTTTLAKMTDGYSGSDLRLVIREAVLNALLENRKELCHQDLLNSIDDFRQRISDYKRSIEA
jgi:SpoVK/Ycf46/Vps4 family AAA+-type ATPase